MKTNIFRRCPKHAAEDEGLRSPYLHDMGNGVTRVYADRFENFLRTGRRTVIIPEKIRDCGCQKFQVEKE